ncbi:MAG: subtilisin family serine protease [Rhodothermales bacterium]|jgi:subtilisin family serine protease
MTYLPRFAAVAILAAVVLSGCDQTAIVDGVDDVPAVENRSGDPIPGRYIVVMTDDVFSAGKTPVEQAQALATEYGVPAEHVYGSSIVGFSAPLSGEELARLRDDDRVAYVEPDRWVVLDPIQIQGRGGKPGGGGGAPPAQSEPWGITRVNGDTDPASITSPASGTAWILDTGIDLDHPDLNVDDSRGFSAFDKGKDAGFDDGHGHGTHVSGTIGALNNSIGVVGVAPGSKVVPVKVLSSRGSGSYSGIIAGINHVGANGAVGDVANMSLGGGFSQAVNDAVIGASSRVKFAVAAGNDGSDANSHSPASANGTNIYTIAATDINDNFATWSNYGQPPVDYAAPGVNIESTWKDGGYNTISGTSMATPHVAGILLLGGIASGGTTVGLDQKIYMIAIH